MSTKGSERARRCGRYGAARTGSRRSEEPPLLRPGATQHAPMHPKSTSAELEEKLPIVETRTNASPLLVTQSLLGAGNARCTVISLVATTRYASTGNQLEVRQFHTEMN